MATLVAQTIGRSLAEGYASVRLTDEPAARCTARAGTRSPSTTARCTRHAGPSGDPVVPVRRTDCRHPNSPNSARCIRSKWLLPRSTTTGYCASRGHAPFSTRVSGEIDFSNRHLVRTIIDKELDRALRAASQTDEIQVHLESLRFADVTTIIQFVQAAEGSRRATAGPLRGATVHPPCTGPVRSGLHAQLTLREAILS